PSWPSSSFRARNATWRAGSATATSTTGDASAAGCDALSASRERHACLQLSKGTLSGTLVQGTAMLGSCDPNPPYSCPEADLFTAPAGKFLVITQVCGSCSLVAPAGRIGGAPSGGQCIRFDPGWWSTRARPSRVAAPPAVPAHFHAPSSGSCPSDPSSDSS